MVRSTDRPPMTIAVDLGRKATKQTNKYRGFFMSAHVLLNSNELGKRDKMRGLPSILSLFLQQFLIKFQCLNTIS